MIHSPNPQLCDSRHYFQTRVGVKQCFSTGGSQPRRGSCFNRFLKGFENIHNYRKFMDIYFVEFQFNHFNNLFIRHDGKWASVYIIVE